ncbi:MAG: hypothetical protein AMXMBFR67_33300 [Nitrospira sp.]
MECDCRAGSGCEGMKFPKQMMVAEFLKVALKHGHECTRAVEYLTRLTGP